MKRAGRRRIGVDSSAQPHDAQIHPAIEWILFTLLAQTHDTFARENSTGVSRNLPQWIQIKWGRRHIFGRFVGKAMGGEVENASSHPHLLCAEISRPSDEVRRRALLARTSSSLGLKGFET